MVEVKDNGDLLQKVPYTHCCTEWPQPCSRPRVSPTHTSAGDSWTLTGKSGSASCGITVPSCWVLVHTNFCLCPPRVFPQCCGSSVVKSHRPSKSNPLVVLSTFARSPVGESLWTVDLLQQWKNFLGVTVLQFVGCLLDHSMVGNTV